MAKLIQFFRSVHHFNYSPLKFRTLSQSQFASVNLRVFSSGSSSDKIIDPEDLTPPIPPYTERTGESLELKRARLLYQSRKRGMLENGLLLSTFAAKYLNTFTEDQISAYDKLINKPTNDWEIYYWATGVKEIPLEYVSDVMDLLKAHVRNDDKDIRIRQPDL